METISAWHILDFPEFLAPSPSLTVSPLFYWDAEDVVLG